MPQCLRVFVRRDECRRASMYSYAGTSAAVPPWSRTKGRVPCASIMAQKLGRGHAVAAPEVVSDTDATSAAKATAAAHIATALAAVASAVAPRASPSPHWFSLPYKELSHFVRVAIG